jgi:hypothetical protein
MASMSPGPAVASTTPVTLDEQGAVMDKRQGMPGRRRVGFAHFCTSAQKCKALHFFSKSYLRAPLKSVSIA